MVAAPFASTPDAETPVHDNSITAMLPPIEAMLGTAVDRMHDAEYYEGLLDELKRLHVRLRVHHAADQMIDDRSDVTDTPPEFMREKDRLRAEHTAMLGTLDRAIRAGESMADRTVEDKEVFFARIRELIATTRRHEAEEDRLFHLSVWRETGGES